MTYIFVKDLLYIVEIFLVVFNDKLFVCLQCFIQVMNDLARYNVILIKT